MNIQGEYEINILIQNMFNSYNLIIKNHNIVTSQGLSFILQCVVNQSNAHFGKVHIGKNSDIATMDDTINTFSQSVELDSAPPVVENNQLTYTINTTGEVLNDTTEIGIWSDDEKILVTRDVHDRYDIPSDAQITLTYTLTINNTEEEKGEEEEENYD